MYILSSYKLFKVLSTLHHSVNRCGWYKTKIISIKLTVLCLFPDGTPEASSVAQASQSLATQESTSEPGPKRMKTS